MAIKKKSAKKSAAKKPVVRAAAVSNPPVRTGKKKCAIAWKKILIFILGILIGFAACLVVCKGGCGRKIWKHRTGPGYEMKFSDNGCLDLSKVRDREKLAHIRVKDANGDGCITKEEFFGDKPAPQGPRGPRKPRAPRPAPAE